MDGTSKTTEQEGCLVLNEASSGEIQGTLALDYSHLHPKPIILYWEDCGNVHGLVYISMHASSYSYCPECIHAVVMGAQV